MNSQLDQGSAVAANRQLRRDVLILGTVLIAACLVLIAAVLLKVWGPGSLVDLQYGTGTVAQSLLTGHGLMNTYPAGGPGTPIIDFQSTRMPVAPAANALDIAMFGRYGSWKAALLKNLLAFLPMGIAMVLVLQSALRERTRIAAAALLLLPFLVPSYLQVITTLQTEEGFVYSLFALSLTMVLFDRIRTLGQVLLFAAAMDLLYLSKSSVIVVVFVLALAAVVRLPTWRLRAVLCVAICMVPLGWGAYQKHAGGRFTFGTSYDGVNLAKGNNPYFFAFYPPDVGNADEIVPMLAPEKYCSTEWVCNDGFRALAVRYVRTHPRETLRADVLKADVMLFTLHRGVANAGRAGTLARMLGLVVLRVMVWISIVIAGWAAWTDRGVGRRNGVLYLAVVVAYCVPYIAGFGLLRHAFILLSPAVLLCTRALIAGDGYEHFTRVGTALKA